MKCIEIKNWATGEILHIKSIEQFIEWLNINDDIFSYELAELPSGELINVLIKGSEND